MKELTASKIMNRPVVSARAKASARDVALQMMTGLYSGMPVTDDEGKVIGVVTEMDLLAALAEGKELVRLTAEDIMSRDVKTVGPDTPVAEIIQIMKAEKVIRLPVVDKDGKLVGIVARCDILKSQIEPEFVTYF